MSKYCPICFARKSVGCKGIGDGIVVYYQMQFIEDEKWPFKELICIYVNWNSN